MKIDEINKAELNELYNVESKTLEIYMFKKITAEKLKLFLAENKDIEKLSLNSCELSDGCIQVIADFLCFNNKLEILNLENTGIGKDGIILLSNAIKQNNFLKYLYLAGNEGLYEIESIKELKNAMEHNQSITLVNLYNHATDSQWLATNSNGYSPMLHKLDLLLSQYKTVIEQEAYKNKTLSKTVIIGETVIPDNESDLCDQDF